MDAWIKIEDGQINGALRRLIALGRDASPAMRDIAAIGENSTRARFRSQTGPDGVKWQPSLRAQLAGGRTLTKDGHLSGSINGRAGADFAEWGVNRIYAAIHQFGGTIRAKSGGALKFRLPGGGFAVVKAVKMPARPFLGVNADDRDDILDALARRINGAIGGASHAG
ncbi:phage virion morphogenesis protein [Rhodocyclus tenuis]|uniref:Phage virion morphogenesis protein n=1 Tax=Rhodocyclus tenuis TaxID=1066 RepID=A0A840FXM8_RHOTE|nr:phage virion morphogenesis protein [Rhodocyclus tenuis]MBB4246554.1 phage virion morphogenesis protein [Rhodocyclus tenuis]